MLKSCRSVWLPLVSEGPMNPSARRRVGSWSPCWTGIGQERWASMSSRSCGLHSTSGRSEFIVVRSLWIQYRKAINRMWSGAYEHRKLCNTYNNYYYRSVPGKWPWVLKHNSQFCPTWALIWDINCIHLYGICCIDTLRSGTWQEWVLAPGHYSMLLVLCTCISHSVNASLSSLTPTLAVLNFRYRVLV